jgi:hypothetical protein
VPGSREIEPAISRRRFKEPPSPGRPNSLDAVNVESPPGVRFRPVRATIRASSVTTKGKNMRRLLALPLVALVGLLAVGAANAGRIQQQLTCDTLGTITVTVTNTTNDHSVAWGTGKVSSSLHGIPVSFSGTTTDLTTGLVLGSFSQAKGQGRGMHNQQTVNCTEAPQVGTAADFGIQGVAPTDMIEFDFSAQVALKP